MMKSREHDKSAEAAQVGLCYDCMYARKIESARGSTFYLCERSVSDPTFPKYPRLPIIRCSGYAPSEGSN
jgi:hypothetical protein